VVSHSTLSLGGSVEYACNAIRKHWSDHSADLMAAKQQDAAPTAPSSAPAGTPDPAAGRQVSVLVESEPAAADIEIDGGFVGSTPSTLSLTAGSHKIVVKKKGFADWTRTMNVSGGSVRLHADLEPNPAGS
jgi:hypothetical protein